MLRWIAVFMLLAPLVSFGAVPVAAHQQKAAITTVEHNPRSGMIEVVHTIALHDAEHALRHQGRKGADLLGDVESRRAFARYAVERFSIAAQGQQLDLTLLGTQVVGNSLLVLQEGPSPGVGVELTIQAQVLTDIWLRQVNSVNVGRGTSPRTLIFRSGDQPKTAVLS